MRPVFPFDLEMATRALLPLASETQAAAMDALIVRAETADRYRKSLGLAHPVYGSGTLASAIGPLKTDAKPRACDQTYLATLAIVISRLQMHQSHQIG